MTGWRIGYISGPPDIVDAINQLQQYIVFSSSSIAQYAALEAIKHPPHYLKEKYQAKRDLARRILSETFPEMPGGEGAFYYFLKLPDGLEDRKVVNQLYHSGVIVLPGSAFCGKNNYIRISFAGNINDLQSGLERVQQSIHTLLETRGKPLL
jgi:aminotransferase